MEMVQRIAPFNIRLQRQSTENIAIEVEFSMQRTDTDLRTFTIFGNKLIFGGR